MDFCGKLVTYLYQIFGYRSNKKTSKLSGLEVFLTIRWPLWTVFVSSVGDWIASFMCGSF